MNPIAFDDEILVEAQTPLAKLITPFLIIAL